VSAPFKFVLRRLPRSGREQCDVAIVLVMLTYFEKIISMRAEWWLMLIRRSTARADVWIGLHTGPFCLLLIQMKLANAARLQDHRWAGHLLSLRYRDSRLLHITLEKFRNGTFRLTLYHKVSVIGFQQIWSTLGWCG
jgi:hypothetical protein